MVAKPEDRPALKYALAPASAGVIETKVIGVNAHPGPPKKVPGCPVPTKAA